MPSASVQSSGSGSGRGRGHQYLRPAGQTAEEPALQTDGLLGARRDSGGETKDSLLHKHTLCFLRLHLVRETYSVTGTC